MTDVEVSERGARRRCRATSSHTWRGQSLVELALLLPLFTIILLGAVDLGRAFFAYDRLANAVHEGALYGAQYPGSVSSASQPTSVTANPNNITYHVISEGSLGLTASNVSVVCYRQSDTTFSTPIACDGTGSSAVNAGDWIQVQATYTFQPMTTRILGLFPSGWTLRKTVRTVVL